MKTTLFFALTRQAWDQRIAQLSREHPNHPDLEETVMELYQIGLAQRWIQDPVIVLDSPTRATEPSAFTQTPSTTTMTPSATVL